MWIFGSFYPKGPSISDVGNRKGEGVKNGSKVLTDSTKKLPICVYGGGGCQKFRNIADVVYGWSLFSLATLATWVLT